MGNGQLVLGRWAKRDISGQWDGYSPIATRHEDRVSEPDSIVFFWLESVLSRGKYLKTKAQKALTSSSIWRRVNLITRRPDHLVSRPAYPELARICPVWRALSSFATDCGSAHTSGVWSEYVRNTINLCKPSPAISLPLSTLWQYLAWLIVK